MIPVYRGFDGLDVSFQAQISNEFSRQLDAAKLHAQQTSADVCMPYAGLMLMVAGSGAKGGYTYRVSTGKTGATWFFKRPNPRDPWGVRVSCSSFMLAENGLGHCRARIYRTMDRIGIRCLDNAESISRVDFAVDILAPRFTLNPDAFIMHSNANRSEHLESDSVIANGKSGRVTSVTIGRMPGRQIIVYDKRAEAIARHKWAWFEIWNARLSQLGLSPLDPQDPASSRIWRAEVRAGKTHLKERWAIRSWSDLDARFGDVVMDATNAIRMTEPSPDKNRSRWTNCKFWEVVRRELEEDLFEMRNFADPNLIKRVHKEAHLRLLYRQGLGLTVTQAAIEGISIDKLAEYAREIGERYARDIRDDNQAFEAKFRRGEVRYHAQN